MGYRYLIYVGLTTDSEGRKIKGLTRKFGNAVPVVSEESAGEIR